jgi:hypothetical protein
MNAVMKRGVRGRLSALEYLLAAQAKLSQASVVLRSARSLHGPQAFQPDGHVLQAIENHVALALEVIASLRQSRTPAQPAFNTEAQIISNGRVLFATRE